MEWTTAYVSSVTNAMRGKKVLERQGFTAYIQRASHTQANEGCGYSLLTNGTNHAVSTALSKAGIRVLRMENGGMPR